MTTPSFGSGSTLLGNTDALTQAMQSRGVDTSILDQVSGSSATFNPSVANVGSNLPSQTSQPTQTTPTTPDTDVTIIIKALTKYLGNTQKNLGVGTNQPSF